MNKKVFWTRTALYITIGGIIPFMFLVWRFDLFKKVSAVSIGGWGLLAVIFISLFFIKLTKSIRDGLTPSLLTQILEGLCKVIIPLIAAAVCVYYFRDMMAQLFQFLCVLIFCESAAIVINPFPQWIRENKKEQQESDTKTLLTALGIIKEEEKK